MIWKVFGLIFIGKICIIYVVFYNKLNEIVDKLDKIINK